MRWRWCRDLHIQSRVLIAIYRIVAWFGLVVMQSLSTLDFHFTSSNFYSTPTICHLGPAASRFGKTALVALVQPSKWSRIYHGDRHVAFKQRWVFNDHSTSQLQPRSSPPHDWVDDMNMMSTSSTATISHPINFLISLPSSRLCETTWMGRGFEQTEIFWCHVRKEDKGGVH